MTTMKWHNEEVETIFKHLESGQKGLSLTEAEQRLHQYGPNELTEKKKKNTLGNVF